MPKTVPVKVKVNYLPPQSFFKLDLQFFAFPSEEEIKKAYETLELEVGASENEINKAYKKLCLEYAPDKFKQKTNCAQESCSSEKGSTNKKQFCSPTCQSIYEDFDKKFKEIGEARDILLKKDEEPWVPDEPRDEETLSLISENKELQENLILAAQIGQALNIEVGQLKSRIKNLENELTKKALDLESEQKLSENWKHKERELNSKIRQLEDEKAGSENKIWELEEEIKKLKLESRGKEKKETKNRENLKENEKRLAEKVKRLETELTKAQDLNKKTRNDYEELNSEKKQLEEHLVNSGKEFFRMGEEIKKLKAEKEKLVHDYNNGWIKLQTELENSNNQKEKIELLYHNEVDKNKKLEEKIEDFHTELNATKKERDKLEKSHKTIKENFDEALTKKTYYYKSVQQKSEEEKEELNNKLTQTKKNLTLAEKEFRNSYKELAHKCEELKLANGKITTDKEKIQKKLDQIQAERENLTDQLSETKQQNNQLSNQLTESKNKITRLEQVEKELLKENKKLKLQKETKKKKNSSPKFSNTYELLEDQAQEINNSKQVEKDDLKKQLAEKDQELEKLQKVIKEQQDQITNLKNNQVEVDPLKKWVSSAKKNGELETALNQARDEIKNLKSNQTYLGTKAEATEIEKNNLQNQLTEIQNYYRGLFQKLIQELQKTNPRKEVRSQSKIAEGLPSYEDALIEQIRGLQEWINDLNIALEDSQGERQEAINELADKKEQIEREITDKRNLKNQVKRLKKEIEELDRQKKKSLTHAADNTIAISTELNQKRVENKNLQNNLAEAQRELEKLVELEQTITNLNAELTRLQTELNKEKAKRIKDGEKAEKVIGDSEQELAEKEDELAQADNLLEQEREECAHLEDQVKDLQKQLTKQKKQADEHLENVKLTSRTKRQELKSKLKNKDRELKNTETDKQELEKSLNSALQEIEKLNTQISELEKGWMTSQQEVEKTAQRYRKRIKKLTGIDCEEEKLTELATKLGGAKLTALPVTLAEYLTQNQDNYQHLEDAHADLIELRKKVAEQTKQLGKKEETIREQNKLIKRLNEVEEKLIEVHVEIKNELTKEQNKRIKDNQRAEEVIGNLEKEIANLDDLFASKNSQLSELNKVIKERDLLSAQKSKLRDKLERTHKWWQEEVDEMDDKIKKLKQKNKDLTAELKQEQKENKKLIWEKERFEEEAGDYKKRFEFNQAKKNRLIKKLHSIREQQKLDAEKAQQENVCQDLIKWEGIPQNDLIFESSKLEKSITETNNSFINTIATAQTNLKKDLTQITTPLPDSKSLDDLITFYNDNKNNSPTPTQTHIITKLVEPQESNETIIVNQIIQECDLGLSENSSLTQVINRIKKLIKVKPPIVQSVIKKDTPFGESLATIIQIDLYSLEKELGINLSRTTKKQIQKATNYQELSILRNQEIKSYLEKQGEMIITQPTQEILQFKKERWLWIILLTMSLLTIGGLLIKLKTKKKNKK